MKLTNKNCPLERDVFHMLNVYRNVLNGCRTTPHKKVLEFAYFKKSSATNSNVFFRKFLWFLLARSTCNQKRKNDLFVYSQCVQIFRQPPRECLPGEEVVHHPDDGGALGVGDPVEDLVDLVRVADRDGDGVGGGQGVHAHHGVLEDEKF